MDPYEENAKKVLSPLDKISEDIEEIEKEKEVEESASLSSIEQEQEEDSSLADVSEAFVEHLADLRKQLIKGLAVFVFFFIIVFATVNKWLPYVTRGHDLVILGPLEVIKFYMSISTTLALGLSLPFLMHFVWNFIKPGLKENEKGFLGLYSPVMLVLFVIGVAFGYYVLNPLSYSFLVGIGESNFDVMISASQYMSYLIMTTVPIGLLFELPILAMFLSTIGVLTSVAMKSIRKWSYVSMAVLSALITPPDFMSQLIVLIPMILLYEISILLVKKIERKQAAKLEKESTNM
ncbi:MULTISPECIES: twin-arginine translocase subunit TatC [unclassified Rummeliibacillus]|uniref:twin-arginine translocase subunit TatC n=1 Tax=unclassified Rummeliibacillus TaxID=2622809 RepID=UPI000E66E6BE|nr:MULTISPECIES: twin-arginine translocase subunit TatC [unclassified Rummeliibacillus]RIJ63032.1 twin-arginine translocase subunit TatC [Rummeliibacillus sp. POC4]RPJ96571.1 twin-arginine translocase subunit TatC [Rummeliibacillus sp. TYF005]